MVHELIDAILESEQSKGGEDSVEKLLRVANREIPGQSEAYTHLIRVTHVHGFHRVWPCAHS